MNPLPPAPGLQPLVPPPGLTLTPEQFALVCKANPEAVLELTWEVFDSSTGFRLADGSVLSPDLVGELVSPSDEGDRASEALRRKMAAYLANGARLGRLLFPEQRAVEIWQPGADPAVPVVMERIEPGHVLEGGEWLPGLPLWTPSDPEARK